MATSERVDPFKNFRFRVEIQGIQVAAFANATVPDESMDAIDYREGTDPYIRKLSGLTKYGTISLKRGISSSLALYEWWRKISSLGASFPGARKNVSIILIGDNGDDVARWDCFNAWPSKYEPGELDAKGNDVLIESIEVQLESVKRAK